MRSLVGSVFLVAVALSLCVSGQEKVSQRPYMVELTGACSPGEMSVEFFITGSFGGYSSFIKTDPRFPRYDVPTTWQGLPARTLKIIVRGARCRTQVIDLPELQDDGRIIRIRLRRSRPIEFRGTVRSPDLIPRKHVLTAEYWAHWKCEFIGVPDCLIGPNRMDVTEVGSDGKFKVRLPDVANDPALSRFVGKGTFQFFIRDRNTGEILFSLKNPNDLMDSGSVPVASGYPIETVFVLEPRP